MGPIAVAGVVLLKHVVSAGNTGLVASPVRPADTNQTEDQASIDSRIDNARPAALVAARTVSLTVWVFTAEAIQHAHNRVGARRGEQLVPYVIVASGAVKSFALDQITVGSFVQRHDLARSVGPAVSRQMVSSPFAIAVVAKSQI
eukprot:GHVN01093756.1.p2 GENE.GHVN01093756.1~~GHVN01093756.1.p2  ORF type:complete len:145 (-),score=6.07 GHVN01093756.1:208-642(-)